MFEEPKPGEPPYSYDDEVRRPAMLLNLKRRRALSDVTSLLTVLANGTALLTDAAQRYDLEAVAGLRATLAELHAHPGLDLPGIIDTYNGLRLAVVEHLPEGDSARERV